MPPKPKIERVELGLADKIKVIQAHETSGKSQRKLAEEFKVGKTQIQQI